MWELREVPAELRARYLAKGYWTDATFASFIEGEVTARPTFPSRSGRPRTRRASTVRDLYDQALRLAGSLNRRGIRAGDVVAYQTAELGRGDLGAVGRLPLGAVMVPIVHPYGAREVEFILRQSGARALVTVDRFGHVDHLANLAGFRDRLDALEHVIVLRSGTPGPSLAGRAPARRSARR